MEGDPHIYQMDAAAVDTILAVAESGPHRLRRGGGIIRCTFRGGVLHQGRGRRPSPVFFQRRSAADGGDPMRVLVVEDEVRLAATLQDLLEMNGYAADVCHDGESGLDNALRRHL